MLSTRDIQRKIRTVRNIQQICRAMKTVSSIKLRKAEVRCREAEPYATALGRVVRQLGALHAEHPLLQTNDVACSGVVAISADKGLAGSYNAAVLREAVALAQRLGEVETVPIGRRMTEAFRRRGFPVATAVSPLGNTPEFSAIAAAADLIGRRFTDGVWGRVDLVYTRAGGGVVTEQLLPLQPREEEDALTDVIFEPDAETLLHRMLPRYLRAVLFAAVLAASAAEHAARVAAMSLATDNADELIDQLTTEYNKSRQAAITRELTDIVGAAEALTS